MTVGDRYRLDPKSEPIGALFSYAVRQERGGEAGLFDVILDFVKVNFRRYLSSVSFLDSMGPGPFTHASPRAIILATPHLDLERESLSLVQDLIPKWVAAVSVAPHTEEFAGNVVDALLQIAANPDLRSLIPADVWLWLNERPSLPSESRGRLMGGRHDIFWTVRGLKNIGVLTSYLTLVWPMNSDGDFAEMQMSVREDFNGIGAGRHRAELIQRVDDVLGESDWEPGDYRRIQSREIKETLRELDREATEILNRMPHSFIFLDLPALMDLYRIPLDVYLCPASPVSIISHLERLASFSTGHFLHPQSVL